MILSFHGYAQTQNNYKKIFIRVYDLQGHKIGKGKIVSITDSIIHLKRDKKSAKISMNYIGKIKTKRSAGNNILTGSVIGATTLGIIMAKPSDGDGWMGGDGYTAVEGALGGVVMGGTTGAVLGAITVPFKFSKSYVINGDRVKWKAFTEMITN